MQWRIFATILFLIIIAGVGMAFLPKTSSQPPSTSGMVNLASSTAPSLVEKVGYSSDLPREVRQAFEKSISELRQELSLDYKVYNSWLGLAIYYKQVGDYEKARVVWEYLLGIHPQDAVTLHNLGDLYRNNLKDYSKAEGYYKRAIESTPTVAIDYIALHELYRYQLKTPEAAIDILKTGIENVPTPEVISLYVALAQYYHATGNTSESISNYTKARDVAREAGNAALAAQFDAEIDALR